MTGEPVKQAELDSLIIGHFDGTLNEEQEKDLASALKTSAESKQRFLSYMRMEGRLVSLGRDRFLSGPADESAASEVDPLAQAVDTEPLGRQRLRLFAASSVAVCAAVVLMLISGLLSSSSVSASGVLQRAQDAAAELIDRTYLVTISREGERASMRELRVDARGGGQFVLRPVDEEYLVGSDGTDYWLARQDGPVWVTSKRSTLVPRLRRTMENAWLFGIASSPSEPLLLDMSEMLSVIERRHDIELIASDNEFEHHIRATVKRGRRNTPQNAPDRIDVWVDAETGVGLRAEMWWADGRRMRFELVQSVQLSDHWYHYSEHVPGREVRRLSHKGRHQKNP